MSEKSDAHVFVRNISQVLSVEKLHLGFLIGAGCPVSVKVPVIVEGQEPTQAPLIPDVSGLTALVQAELGQHTDLKEPFDKILNALRDDGNPSPNVEQILGFVRTLIAAVGVGKVRGLESSHLLAIDKEICRSIFEKVNRRLPATACGYRSLAYFMAPRRRNPVEIFTTNYDLLMEQALEESRVPYFDGFVGSFHPFFDLLAIEQDALPPRWARLWKLHGSINWKKMETTKQVCRTMSQEAAGELLIHPSHEKYQDSRRMPYLAFIDRLRSFVRNNQQPAALFVLGYSFGDEHVNAAIEESLRANPHAACFAMQYGNIDDYPLAKTLAQRCPNLTVYAKDADFSNGVIKAWQVVQSPNNARLSGIFEWDSSELEGESQEANAQLLLGDFAKFGDFLRSVAGADLERGANV